MASGKNDRGSEKESMKLMLRSIVATAWACLLASGCGRAPAPAQLDVGGPNGLITWTAAGKDNPVPGIDQGTVYHLGRTFVLWSDAPGGGGGTSSSNGQSVKCQGSLLAPGGRTEFTCETTDGNTWRVAISGVSYDLAKGNLFLLSPGGERSRVKQLKRDLSKLNFERDELDALARNDPEIAGFFAKALPMK
jgi:hypothetical protein